MWLKLDDQAMTHPKVAALSDAALRLWLRGLSYCANTLSDGRVPRSEALGMAVAITDRNGEDIGKSQALIGELLAVPDGYKVGLWERDGDGYSCHDYLEYQPSRQKVEGDRAAARERMQRIRSGAGEGEQQRERSAERSREHDGERAGEVRRPRPRPRSSPDPGEEPPHSPPAAGGSVARETLEAICDDKPTLGRSGSTGTSTTAPDRFPRQAKQIPGGDDLSAAPPPMAASPNGRTSPAPTETSSAPMSPRSDAVPRPSSGSTKSSAPTSSNGAAATEEHGNLRTPTAEIEAVFDAHDLGLRTLREAQGRVHQPHARKGAGVGKKRRRAVAEAIAAHGLPAALLAARNLPLSAHHRGVNDQRTEYLEIDKAFRAVEKYADMCRGDGASFRREVEVAVRSPPPPRRGGYGGQQPEAPMRDLTDLARETAEWEARMADAH